MTEMRVRDWAFLLIVVPIAILALYWYGWRADAGGRVDALRARSASLIAEDDFDETMAAARRDRAAAERELAAERRVPPPVMRMKGNPAATEAERVQGLGEIFRRVGLEIRRSSAESAPSTSAGGARELLRSTGMRPDPVRRTYEIEGSYPAMRQAFESIVAAEAAILPESVSFAPGGRWILSLWL